MQLIPSYCSSFIALCLPFVSCNVVILVVHFDNDTFKWKSDQDHVFFKNVGQYCLNSVNNSWIIMLASYL
jgi:hypothetical protein